MTGGGGEVAGDVAGRVLRVTPSVTINYPTITDGPLRARPIVGYYSNYSVNHATNWHGLWGGGDE